MWTHKDEQDGVREMAGRGAGRGREGGREKEQEPGDSGSPLGHAIPL